MNKHALGSGLLLILWCGVLGLTAAFTQQLKPARPGQTSLQQMNIVSAQATAIHFVASPPVTPTEPFTTAWSHSCVVGRRMAITGIGMGDPLQAINPQTITLADPNSVAGLRVQVAGRRSGASPVPEWVVLTTDTQPLTLTKVYSPSHAYTFEVDLQATRHITALISNTGNDYKTPRGLILYSLRNTNGEWSSVGKTMSEFVYKKIYTEALTFPYPLEQPTDVEVTAVIIDNDNDDRPLVMTATAGSAVTASKVITGPTDGPLLNIVPLTLSHVPTHTDRITITLQSPEQNGDSLVLVGLNVSYPCSREGADLEISQTADITTINESELITYTITVTNNGPSHATSVSVTDQLPAGLIYGGYTATRGIYTKDTDQWNVGGLANMATATLIITATANECSGASIVNTAVVTAAIDSNPDNNEATASVTSTVGTYCIYLPIIHKNYEPCRFYDFSTQEGDWINYEDSHTKFGYINGEFQMVAKNPNWTHLAWPRGKYENYTITATVRWAGNSAKGKKYGLTFGIADNYSSFYTFMVYPDAQDYEIKYYNGAWNTLYFGHSPAINTDVLTNHLWLERLNGTISITINNTSLASISAPQISEKRHVGIGVGPYTLYPGNSYADARFDDYQICPMDAVSFTNLDLLLEEETSGGGGKSIPGG